MRRNVQWLSLIFMNCKILNEQDGKLRVNHIDGMCKKCIQSRVSLMEKYALKWHFGLLVKKFGTRMRA